MANRYLQSRRLARICVPNSLYVRESRTIPEKKAPGHILISLTYFIYYFLECQNNRPKVAPMVSSRYTKIGNYADSAQVALYNKYRIEGKTNNAVLFF